MTAFSFSGFDIVLFIVIIFFTARCAIKGFVDEFFSKAAVICGCIAAVFFFRKAAPAVARITGPNSIDGIIAFLLIFVVVYFVIKMLQRIVSGAFVNVSLRNLDRALGFFLGIAEGLLVAIVVLVILVQQPFFDASPILEGSFFAALFSPLSGIDLLEAAPQALKNIL